MTDFLQISAITAEQGIIELLVVLMTLLTSVEILTIKVTRIRKHFPLSIPKSFRQTNGFTKLFSESGR